MVAVPQENSRSLKKAKRGPKPIVEQMDEEVMMPEKKKKKKKAKKKPGKMLEYLMPTQREVSMADAYGGNAKGQFRRNGVKYDKERLQNRIKTPANIPGGKTQLEALAATVAGFNKVPLHNIEDSISMKGAVPNFG